jgi:hypothetical protein
MDSQHQIKVSTIFLNKVGFMTGGNKSNGKNGKSINMDPRNVEKNTIKQKIIPLEAFKLILQIFYVVVRAWGFPLNW